MPSIPYTRKAGDGGACAVIIGIGDKSLLLEAAPLYDRTVLICLPGETPITGLPKHIPQYVATAPESAASIVSQEWGMQTRIAALEATDFYGNHPCPLVDVNLREQFKLALFGQLAMRPYSLGDDIIDGIQGALHIAKSAHLTVGAPTPDEIPKFSCPAIAVASGPSLANHIDELRRLQYSCLIFCADTALEGLLKAGITPHFVTPLERTEPGVEESFPRAKYPGVIFAGAAVVDELIPPKFDRHLLIPGSDVLFLWAGARTDQLFFYGQSTGVLAATLALQMTTGPVYLVGHDLAYGESASHWDGVAHTVQLARANTFFVEGNSGQPVETQQWWQIFRQEIGDLAQASGRLVNVNAHTKVGAVIPHALAGPLPNPDSLEPFIMPTWPEPNMARQGRFAELMRRLPGDVRGMLLKLSSAKLKVTDIRIDNLCPGGNGMMISYVVRSVISQFSMQYLNGQPEKHAANDCADALRNAIRQLLPMFEQMAAAPIAQEPVCVG